MSQAAVGKCVAKTACYVATVQMKKKPQTPNYLDLISYFLFCKANFKKRYDLYLRR